MKRSTRCQGFSLLELLLVVAVIAALVGWAVPTGCGNLLEGQRTKCRQDLEVLQVALDLYHRREGSPLRGTSLHPLLGRYLQELPLDPWGNAYLFSSQAGVVGSLGADSLPGGRGADADVLVSVLAGPGPSTTADRSLLAALHQPRCDLAGEEPRHGSWLRSHRHRRPAGAWLHRGKSPQR